MKENKLIPELRFPEFENDGEWVEKVLSEVANYENGKAHEKDIDENGDYIVVNSKFISTDGEVAKYSNTAFCLAEKGDVLMVLSDVPNGRAIAKCFYVSEENKYTVNQRICKITSIDSDSLFLYYIMNRNPYFLSFDDGVKQTNLRNDDVQSFPFLIPDDIEEQQKIASCLSSLDELLAAHKDKLDALKDHKKGLLQNLFPQKDETVPKVRFPEFEEDGEWVEKKLNTLSKRVIAKNRNGKFTAVFTNSATAGIVDQRDYFDKDIANKKNLENYFVVQNGDYVYNPRISEHAPVGPLFKNRLGKTGVMSPLYMVFRFNEKNNDFYEYYFQTSHWRNSIRAIANTGARFDRISITASLFMEIPVLYTGLMEQQKIASCLSAVDELITAQQEKIEQLQQHKKGLMQVLFPKMIEHI